MATIGVRELRRDASRWLARVRAGEVIVVTDRGRPIAQMVPLGEPEGYEALIARGKIAPGSGRPIRELLAELDRELPPDEGPSVSAALTALREGER